MTSHATGSSFEHRRVVRVAAATGSVGALVGVSLLAASPAVAATPSVTPDTDCNDSNTASTNTGIQDLLTAEALLICVDGTVPITTTLSYDYSGLILHGINDGTLDGGDTTRILEATAPSSSMVIENLTFTRGRASDGAAIHAPNGYLSIVNSTFDHNVATDQGGAIWAYGVEIYESLFEENEATDDGGAVKTTAYTYVETSTFRGNSGLHGGALQSDGEFGGYTFVYQSTFDDNEAGESGGAILAHGLHAENSTFNENTAAAGGAISADFGIVNQNTFYGNVASPEYGQSIYKYGDDTEDDLFVNGNIFAGVDDDGPAELVRVTADEAGRIRDSGGNLFTTGPELWLADVQPSSLFLVPKALIFQGNILADNGGRTWTIALPDGSAAIDFVPVSELSLPVDQRDYPRTTLNDAGAFEHQDPVPTIAATGSEVSAGAVGLGALLLAAGGALLFAVRRMTGAAR